MRDYTLQPPVAAADLGEDDGGHGVDAEQPREVEGHELAQHQLLVRLPVPGITSSVPGISPEFSQYSENIVTDKIRDI